jgi:2-polyprenyl-6-hydroxyphenyl methylase/3-demethylubiquinone-9 3-methyltransferase
MSQTSDTFEAEIAAAKRYGFGKNWALFLDVLDASKIEAAIGSLQSMLGIDRLDGKTFLDIGSGSGLFSLAAHRLGAQVTSFDFDPDSVACAEQLRERHGSSGGSWQVLRGSVLDTEFMNRLPVYDVVYSWGVLHHTGQMHRAITLAFDRVAAGGLFFIALYRKTWLCPLWKVEKRVYVASPPWIRSVLRDTYQATVGLAHKIKNRNRVLPRGMDAERDVDDWLGGYPYESITPRSFKRLALQHGFAVDKQITKSNGISLTHGCDQYVLRRTR